MHWSLRTLTALCVASNVAACGGSHPEASAPKAEAETAKAEPPEDSSAVPKDDESSAPSTKPDSAPSAESTPETKTSARSAEDILTRDGVYFDLSFTESDAHDAADKRCSAKAGDDPQKKAACMSRASDQIEWNGVAFRRDDQGKWWWYTLRRTGAKMVPLHKIRVDFTDDSDHSVTLKTTGRDEGTKPGGLPSKVVVDVPSESQIAITDSKYGKMVFNTKMGLFGKDER